MKIDILDELISKEVTCVLHDGSEMTAVLRGVSHQDAFDVVILEGCEPFRSTALAKLYAGKDLVWPAGAEDDSEARNAARVASKVGYDPALYQRSIGLLDHVVVVSLADGGQVVGRLEVVTPHVGDEFPTLHISSLDSDEVEVVQLGAAVGIDDHFLTSSEVDDIVTEEGQNKEGQDEEESSELTVEAQRAQAEQAVRPEHSEEHTAVAFGLTGDSAEASETPDVEQEDSEPLNEGATAPDAPEDED